MEATQQENNVIQATEQNNPTDILSAQVGEQEGNKALAPLPVSVTSVTVKTHDKTGKKMMNELVQIHVKHPEKSDELILTKAKFLRGDQLAVGSTFTSLDDSGKFLKDSVIARLLNFANVSTLNELVGKQFDTVPESDISKYLALKAY